MYSRYTLVAGTEQLIAEFDLALCEPVMPNHNICPTRLAPLIRLGEDDTGRTLRILTVRRLAVPQCRAG